MTAPKSKSSKAANELTQSKLLEKAGATIAQLCNDAAGIEQEFADILRTVDPAQRPSARNLTHYLAIRRHDIRDLQRTLGKLGLSSLGRSEAHVMASLSSVRDVLSVLNKRTSPTQRTLTDTISFDAGHAILAEHANAILGPEQADRYTRIMVTLPSEAADEPSFIRDLLAQGMNIMRINCAHDNPDIWARMVAHLRKAEKELGTTCRICFDLAGPKLRTGAIEPVPGVIKSKPHRNRLGEFVAPALIRFVREIPGKPLEIANVPVKGDLFGKIRTGDSIEFFDIRGLARSLRVVDVGLEDCVCRSSQTTYLTEGIDLVIRRDKKVLGKCTIGTLPKEPQALFLKPGDKLNIVKGDALGRDALRDSDGRVRKTATISCALEEVFDGVKSGERIFFDDGKLAGIIQDVSKSRIKVKITDAVGGAVKLRDEKGINLPESRLSLPALSSKDLNDLEFIVQHADMVAMSFVQRPEDIEQLMATLKHLQAEHLSIVLKIETQLAFNQLPNLLLTAMRHPHVAVMVARGDLGVEIGFERLAEVQEEILWLCEAAHIPVIWATQVLESLAKGGMPSRAEITDAAMSSRAECVMLNKGPYILQTMKFLCDVLNRMEPHQEKKTPMLRRLSISGSRVGPPRGLPSGRTGNTVDH